MSDFLTSRTGMSPRDDVSTRSDVMCPPVMISLAYPDCYLYGYSHAADIKIHNLFAPDRLIRRPQCIMITLTGEPLAPVKLIHRLQCIVITLPDEEIGLRCPSATCHYVTQSAPASLSTDDCVIKKNNHYEYGR